MYQEVHDSLIEQRAAAPEFAMLLEAYRRSSAAHGVARARDVGGEAFPEIEPNLVVLKPLGDGNYTYLRYGSAIAAVTGIDLTGRSLDTLGGELRRFYRDSYDRALATGRPLFTLHRSTYALAVYAWERLVMPVRDEAGGDLVVVFNKPREMREDLLSAVFAASPDGILALRAVRDGAAEIVDAIIMTVNARAAEILRKPCDELVDGGLLALFPGLRPAGLWDRYLRVMTERRPETFEARYELDGTGVWFRVTAVPLGDGFMMCLTDISALKQALLDSEARNTELAAANQAIEEARGALAHEVKTRRIVEAELRRNLTLDGLTGVLNRRGFDAVVRERTAMAQRLGHSLCVVAIDVDHFKLVNDRHGHAAGDAVLVEVASLLKHELRRGTDAIGRVGGEEFMVLLSDTPALGGGALAERLRVHLMNLPITVDTGQLAVTASFGVAALGPDGDPERMLIEADNALYQAKHGGRNRVVVHAHGDDWFTKLPAHWAPVDARGEALVEDAPAG